jgi:hypothetical protein
MTEYDLKDIKIIKMRLVGIYYVMFLEKVTHMLILVTCYIVMKNITYTSMTGLVIHSGKSPFTRSKFSLKSWSKFFDGNFAQRKLCQSFPVYTIKVFIPCCCYFIIIFF